MNDLTIVFENNPVRNVFQDGEWWFCAKDVCSVLEISKYRDAVSSLDTTQRSSIRVDTPGGQQLTTFVSEDGLYELIFKSNKPEQVDYLDGVRDLSISAFQRRPVFYKSHIPERCST